MGPLLVVAQLLPIYPVGILNHGLEVSEQSPSSSRLSILSNVSIEVEDKLLGSYSLILEDIDFVGLSAASLKSQMLQQVVLMLSTVIYSGYLIPLRDR